MTTQTTTTTTSVPLNPNITDRNKEDMEAMCLGQSASQEGNQEFSRNPNKGKHWKKKSGGAKGGRSQQQLQKQFENKSVPRSVECYRCHKVGHLQKDCWTKLPSQSENPAPAGADLPQQKSQVEPEPTITYDDVLQLPIEHLPAKVLTEATQVTQAYFGLKGLLPQKPKYNDLNVVVGADLVEEGAGSSGNERKTNGDAKVISRFMRDYHGGEGSVTRARWEGNLDGTFDLVYPAMGGKTSRATREYLSCPVGAPVEPRWKRGLWQFMWYVSILVRIFVNAVVTCYFWDEDFLLFSMVASTFWLFLIWGSPSLIIWIIRYVRDDKPKKKLRYYRNVRRVNAPGLVGLPRLEGVGPTRLVGLRWLKFPMAMSEDGCLPLGLCLYLSANLEGVSKEASALAQVPGLTTTWCKEHGIADALTAHFRIMTVHMLGSLKEA